MTLCGQFEILLKFHWMTTSPEARVAGPSLVLRVVLGQHPYPPYEVKSLVECMLLVVA